MATALNRIAELATGTSDLTQVPWHLMRYQHTQAVRTRLADLYSPANVNKHLSALRGVLKEAWRLGLVTGDDYHRAVDLQAVRGDTLPAGRQLSVGEITALFRVCADDCKPSGARDAAMLAILYGTGLRRSEVVAVDLGDYDRQTGTVTVRRGKGNKDRVGYATNGARGAIEAWLEVRGEEAGPLLCPVNRGGQVTVRRLSSQSVLSVARKRAREAGINHFTAHDCRRSFVSHLLDAGADLATVQKLAGHESVITTARYDRRGEVAKKRAAELIHVPFVRQSQ